MKIYEKIISVVGLGYVGLPLAIELGKKFNVIGFDISKNRILNLKKKIDLSKEITSNEFSKSKFLKFSFKKEDLKKSDIYIITVPTPLKNNKKPDISYIIKACDIIFKTIEKGNVIVLESTVYPGFCEEVLAPYIEKKTGFLFNKDFFLGYSPERINPGNSKYKLKNIVKIVSASNKKTLNDLSFIYKSIVNAGIYKVKNIKIAESAKVIENVQRDVNVALINELSMLFNKINIDTKEVLKAANTKWNFLNFSPGLVGGHCIGVDPYYLTFKSKQIGFNPRLILAGRQINDHIPRYISSKIIKNFKNDKSVKGLILGASFKENCTDVRNSGSEKIFNILKKKYQMHIYDPIASENDCKKIYKKLFIKKLRKNFYNFIIIAVGHSYFKKIGYRKIKSFTKKGSILFDVKSIFNKRESQIRL